MSAWLQLSSAAAAPLADNGEFGIYAVVNLRISQSRGGALEVESSSTVRAAQLPLYNFAQIATVAAYTLMIVAVVIGEIEQLAASCRKCDWYKRGGYFMDPSNFLVSSW